MLSFGIAKDCQKNAFVFLCGTRNRLVINSEPEKHLVFGDKH